MKTRIVSALIALILFFAVYFIFQKTGLLLICGLAALMAIREFSLLTFRRITPGRGRYLLFSALCFTNYLAFSYIPAHSEAIFAALSIVFVGSLLKLSDSTQKLSRISLQQGLGVLGFLYCGLFPALATRLLIQFDQGDLWLFTLLAVVFCGDSFAYFVGKTWGKTKLMPQLSPKKTRQGALGGLVGSALAGALAHALFFPQVSLTLLILVGVVTGAFAQAGDLFESLLKRVARVKDSGTIMPGHGGALDRLDGVFFGAPIFYILIQYLVARS